MLRNNIKFGILLLFLCAFAANACPETYIVKGERTLGIKGGYAGYNDSGYASIYFQYSFASHFRISPEVGYVIKNNGKSALLVNADMHFPFRICRGIKIYPLAGATFNNWNYSERSKESRFGADVGGGIDIYFTQNLKINAEAKYSFMPDTSGAFAGLGIGYIF